MRNQALESSAESNCLALQITGDNLLIARETAKALGMGTDIRTSELLPQMMDDGRMPPHLGRDYGHVILPADGFAQVHVFALTRQESVVRHSWLLGCWTTGSA